MCNLSGKMKSYICYDEIDTHVLNTIDDTFRVEAINRSAVEYHIPAMIDKEVLDKCGYFSSFPHHLTAAAHAKQEAYKEITIDKVLSTNTAIISEQYFTPAACLHIYPMLENQSIDRKVITTKARVYRYEDARFDGHKRLWDFTVREIIFIGSPSFVAESLDDMKKCALNYASSINLSMSIVSANDNFYPTKKNAIKQRLQLSNSLKYELTVDVDGQPLAISSFNYHDTHFSRPFNFDNNGEIVTGCVGFGLERWVSAIKYYGINL